jgi:hypothetical protein
MTIADKMTEVLSGLPMVDVLKVVTKGPDQYTVLFKVLDQKAWQPVLAEMLRVEEVMGEDSPFVLHLCRQYVRHEGALRYVPHMTVQGPQGLEEALGGLCALLEELQHEGAIPKAPAAPEPAQAPAAAQPKAQPKPDPQMKVAPMVQTVPLVRSSADRNQPRNSLWRTGSKGAHLIKGQR